MTQVSQQSSADMLAIFKAYLPERNDHQRLCAMALAHRDSCEQDDMKSHRSKLEDMDYARHERNKLASRTEFNRITVDESEHAGYWSFTMYPSTEKEDEDFFYDDPIFEIKGENCYKCGEYLGQGPCKVSVNNMGLPTIDYSLKYPENIKCKCESYVKFLSCHGGPAHPRDM